MRSHQSGPLLWTPYPDTEAGENLTSPKPYQSLSEVPWCRALCSPSPPMVKTACII